MRRVPRTPSQRSNQVRPLAAPPASAPVTATADFLELTAFTVADRNRSIQDLVQITRRSGTIEAIVDPESSSYRRDAGAEQSQVAAEAAFGELEDRLRACGGADDVYPFKMHQTSIELCADAVEFLYTFLLLLSHFGPVRATRTVQPERLFEDLCLCAAQEYFGGAGVEAVHFGFPRRVLPKHFPKALDTLCRQMGDAVANGSAPGIAAQKDATLDIVAWKHFPDYRPGKLLAFGQCATGRDEWKTKLTELQPSVFCKCWLREHPAVDPMRLFFIPHRLTRDEHRVAAIKGGVIFDRCRLAYFARNAPEELRRKCRRWSMAIIERRVAA